MGTTIRSLALGAFLLALSGCGPTVGDACTTVSECGNQLCINNKNYAPGGYCSRQCILGNDSTCPNGSTCVRGGAGDFDACFKICTSNNDCRSGYTCSTFRASTQTVCVGPGA